MKLTTHERYFQRVIVLMVVGFVLRVAGAVWGIIVVAAVMLAGRRVADWLGARVFATGY